MKAIILAGGFGTRFSEATSKIPKPMIEIGNKPILWHIMKIYSHFGINDFVICCGYKQYVIKEYFANYYRHNSDLTVDLGANSISIHETHAEPWKVTLIDTGLMTMTGGRIKRIQKYIGEERFCLTYGDGVADIDLNKELQEHEKSNAILTMACYKPHGRFGSVVIDKDSGTVTSFQEKPDGEGNWINAGFFICEPEVFDFLPNNSDQIMFEREPLEKIASSGKMHAYKHDGFWKPMDMLRDNVELNKLWDDNVAPWKIW